MRSGNSNSGEGRSGIPSFRSWLPWIILALLGLGPLFVCALIGPVNLGSELGLKSAPDWSRGLHIGSDFYGTDSGAALVVDGERRVHLVWPVRLGTREYDLRYARLDEQGVVEEEHDLDLDLYEPRTVYSLLDNEGVIRVFLLASPAEGGASSLFSVALTRDGLVPTPPTLVSSGSRPCYEYDATAGPQGTIYLFWTEGVGAERDLYQSTLSPGLGSAATPRLLARSVAHPVARADGAGTIHLLWEEPGGDEETAQLYYAGLTEEMPESLAGIKLLDLESGIRIRRDPPVVALDRQYAYLAWAVEYRRDLSAPAISQAWYGSFPLDSPSAVSARSFSFPMGERPTYVTHDSPYNYEYMVVSDGRVEVGSDRIMDPYALGDQEEAVVTFSMTVMRGLARENQIINVIFGEGKLIGYQLACNTTHWSRLPNLARDSGGDLHLSWIDGLEPGPSEVYYAATSPLVRRRVDHLTLDDILLALLNVAFGAAAGMVNIPFVVFWVVPPLVWVFISGFFLGESGIRSRRGYVVLGLALLLYQLTKVYFTPALLDYVPFSVSVAFLPPQLYLPLRVAVPICIAAVGAAGVIYALIRAETSSAFTALLAFLLPDAFLTMVIYGPGLAVAG